MENNDVRKPASSVRLLRALSLQVQQIDILTFLSLKQSFREKSRRFRRKSYILSSIENRRNFDFLRLLFLYFLKKVE